MGSARDSIGLGAAVTVKDEDGTVSVSATTLTVNNGALTDNTGGSFSWADIPEGSKQEGAALESFNGNLTHAYHFTDTYPPHDLVGSADMVATVSTGATWGVTGLGSKTAVTTVNGSGFTADFSPGTSDFTLCVWVNLSATTTDNRFAGFATSITENTNRISMETFTNTQLRGLVQGAISDFVSPVMSAATWHLITMMRDSSDFDILHFYLDAVHCGSVLTSAGTDMTTYDLFVGYFAATFSTALSTTFDSIYYWDTDISSAALVEFYNGALGRFLN